MAFVEAMSQSGSLPPAHADTSILASDGDPASESQDMLATKQEVVVMPSDGPLSPKESLASEIVDDDTLISCDFQCGPPMPRSRMKNKANSMYPCWVCNPCFCAMKAIVRSWSSTPETKAMLDNIRKDDKPRWQALVRSCRIKASPDEVGLTDLGMRKKAACEATQVMLQTFGVQDSTEILWLTRKRFIAHQIYVEGIEGATLEQKERAATVRWTKDMQNPDIAKRGTGEDLQLGVVGVSRTVGFRGRESRKEITCSDTIVSGKQMDSYLKDMACHGMSGQALTGKAMGVFGSPFAPGAASSSSVTALAALPVQAPSAPPSSVVCKPEALEPTPGFTGTLATLDRKRSLGRTASDPLKRPKGGVTGDLLVTRGKATDLIKKTLSRYATGKGNLARRWQGLVTKAITSFWTVTLRFLSLQRRTKHSLTS